MLFLTHLNWLLFKFCVSYNLLQTYREATNRPKLSSWFNNALFSSRSPEPFRFSPCLVAFFAPQTGWSHWILIRERNEPSSLFLTWVLFVLPGIGSLLRLQGGLTFNLHGIVTCLHQDRGMPQQDKVLWKFRLLLLASSKGNCFSATHVEFPVANTEMFRQTKATGPLVFTTPKMQPSHTRKSNDKSWISLSC